MTHRVKPARSAGAEILLSRCLGLCPEDRFLLIYDETTLRFPNLFRSVASSLQIDYRKRFVSKVRQANGSAFDAGLEAEIEQVEGILLAVSADPSVDRFRVEMADRRRGRATVATMPGASIEIIDTALDVDYQEITRMARQLAVPLAKGRECTITTFDAQDHPYHLHLDLGGSERMPVQSLALLPRGAWGNVPAGETFIAPVEHVASGEYLVNGAVGRERTLGKDEALLTFEAGRLIEHRYLATGLPVQHLLHLMPIASANNDLASWNVLAEFGIGVNRAIRRIVGVELMDEKNTALCTLPSGTTKGSVAPTSVCRSIAT